MMTMFGFPSAAATAANRTKNSNETILKFTVVLIRKFGSYRKWVT